MNKPILPLDHSIMSNEDSDKNSIKNLLFSRTASIKTKDSQIQIVRKNILEKSVKKYFPVKKI